MCSNNVSELFNKENLQPVSATDFCLHRDEEDSDSDDIFKVRKIRDDSLPVVKLDCLGAKEKLFCDLDKIYRNGVERSIEEIRYDKWLKWKKRKAEKQLIKDMADEIDTLKRKIELDKLSNKQEIKLLQEQLASAMQLMSTQLQDRKQVVEDKQEVSTMIRDLINGSYNDTQIEKTLLKPVSSVHVKDFTIYKDMSVDEQTFVAPAPHVVKDMSVDEQTFVVPAPQVVQDNVPLIHFDTTVCSKGIEKSIENQSCNAEMDIENKEPSVPPEMDIENKEPSVPPEMDIENKEPSVPPEKDSFEIIKPVVPPEKDSFEIMKPVVPPEKDSFEIIKPAPNLQILENSIEIKEPNYDFLVSTDRHDPIDMEIEKHELRLSQIKAVLGETKRKSFATLRENNKLSVIAENSRDSTNVTEKNSPVKMCPPAASCKSIRNDLDLADLSVNPIIHRGSMNFRFSEAFTMHIPSSEDECVPKSCSTPGKTQ